MFVGATLLALGYQIFMGWVANRSAGEGSAALGDPPCGELADRGDRSASL
jgi:hypothetical protein